MLDHSEEEVDNKHEKTEHLLDAETKCKDYRIIMGHFNAVVEAKED